MKRSTIFYIALSLVGTGTVSAAAIAPVAAQGGRTVARTQSTAFAVERMTCALCPVTVKRAMAAVKGVRSVDVDFAAKTATVVFDPKVTNPPEIAAASTNVGYPAAPVR